MKYYRKVLAGLIDTHLFIPGIPTAISGVEVGVAAGKTSAYLLATFPTLHLTCVDKWIPPWAQTPYAQTHDMFAQGDAAAHDERHVKAIAVTRPHRQRVTLLQASSENVATSAPDAWYDFVFIDGDHSYEGVLEDLENWWPKIRAGGLFCGHDYCDVVDEQGLDVRGRGVAKAVKHFLSEQKQVKFLVAEGGVWWSIKPQS